MHVRLIAACGLFLTCHGLSLSAGGSSRNDDMWDSIDRVVDSMKPPRALRAHRRLSLVERPRRGRKTKDSKPQDSKMAAATGAAPVEKNTRADAGARANGTAAKSAADAAGNATKLAAHVLFGGHHKAGARLLESMQQNFAFVMHVKRAQVAGCPHFNSVGEGTVIRPCQLNLKLYKEFMALPGRKRIVHVIRDPLKFVLSTYMYHCSNEDGAFSKRWSPGDLAKMPVEAGLEVVAEFALKSWLKDMYQVHQAIREDGAEALTVRVEDFSESEALFDATSREVYGFLSDGDEAATAKMLETATKHGLFGRTKEFVKQASGSLPAEAHKAYAQMSKLPTNVTQALLELRYQLGYEID